MRMAKRVLIEILKLTLVTILTLVIMVCIVSFLQDDGIGGTAAEPLLMILWELIYVFCYVIIFKKSLYNNFQNYSEKPQFDAKRKLKEHFNSIGKIHLILFAVIAAISYLGAFIKIGDINYFGTVATMVLPIAGIFGRKGFSVGMLGLLCHVILIPPSMLLAQYIHHKRMIKKSLE